MYRTSYQRGMLSVLFSGGSNPLGIWEIVKSQDGYVQRFLDQDIKAMVIEIGAYNVTTTYISCPPGKKVLGICMPFLVMIVKNLNKYFVFQITILDETGTRRRFRIANFQSTTQINPLCTVMPLQLSNGWNQIQFNLAEFTKRAYNKQFVEVQKIRINANIRIRRIYCAERLMSEEELPPEYKLYFPLPLNKKVKGKENKMQKTSVGKSKESEIDVKASDGVLAKAPAKPAEEAPTKPPEGTPVEEVPADRVPAESTDGKSISDHITEEGENIIADETQIESLTEDGAPLVEELAGEEPAADAKAEPSEPALTEPTEPAEPEVIAEAPPSAE